MIPLDKALTAVITKLIRVPFWFQRKRPFTLPKKLLILQPGGLPEILLTTPLLTILANAFPHTQLDWAVYDAHHAILVGNPHLANIISLGGIDLKTASWSRRKQLAQQIRDQQYDTCLVPTASSLLAWLAWQSQIPQRVGLHYQGQGFGYTVTGHPPGQAQHQTEQQLTLIPAMGLSQSYVRVRHKIAFFPSDLDRTAVTHRLVESLNWLGDSPLFLINPGGQTKDACWPLERFVLLCNHLSKTYQAKLVIVGDEADQQLGRELLGLVATAVSDWTGQLTLGELGTLCEVADLYVGNDSDLAYIAAAADCSTIVIYGAERPLDTSPYAPHNQFISLWQPYEGGFSWDKGASAQEAIVATQRILKIEPQKL